VPHSPAPRPRPPASSIRVLLQTAAASSRPDTRASSEATLEARGANASFGAIRVSERDASCPDAGAESRSGCDDPIADGTPFDLWELARSWTPGFCASGGKHTCAKKECAPDAMVPALTLHGLWPSFSTPVAARRGVVPADARAPPPRRASRAPDAGFVPDAPFERLSNLNRKGCFWPQNCGVPAWMRAETEPPPWRYDASLLPGGEANRRLAPAWFADALGAHEWPKHGTCASWADSAGTVRGLDQAAYYRATFDLAKSEGTPDALADAAGGAVALPDLQAMFGGPKRVALGCTAACELVQVVTCYAQGSGAEGDPVGPRERADCPCFGVRDSHYDNSCAEAHACAEVKVLSPEQTGCGGGPRPDACAGGKRCCPGKVGPACAEDADCVGESGCVRCAHSGHCTAEPREE